MFLRNRIDLIKLIEPEEALWFKTAYALQTNRDV